MRIAIAAPGGFDPSGRERVVPALVSLVERLARRHAVDVYVLDGTPRASYELRGACVRSPGGGGLLARARALSAAFRESPPDVAHAFWGGAAAALGLASRNSRVPVVYSVGGGELASLPGFGAGRAWSGRLTTGLALRSAAIVTAGSRLALEPVAPGVAARVIPLGADRALFEAKPPRAPGPPFRLLNVASLNHVKDHETLLTAIALVSRELDVLLDVVGEDTLSGAVQRRAAALGVEGRVRFHGFVPNDEVARFYRAAHAHVVSSRFESQCVAVSEAALAGLPTIGTAVGVLPELAPEAACAVPAGDADALARSLAEVLRDEPRRLALAHAARRWAIANDADATARRFEEIYAELVRARRA